MSNFDNNLHKQFVEYGRNAREWMKKCALLLPKINRERIWEKKKFGSIYEYAAKLAGMSRYQVENALWIVKKVEDRPLLKKVIEEKGINSVRPVLSIVEQESKDNEGAEKFWANKARSMSKNELTAYVKEYRKQEKSCTGTRFGQNSVNNQLVNISMEVPPEVADKLKKLKGDNEWKDLMVKFLKMREEKLEAEKPEKVVTDSRHIPAKIEKFVVKRSNGICEYPGCYKKYKILHHTKRFALHREHDPDTIVALCKAHERLMHRTLIENEEKLPENWEIRKFPNVLKEKFFVDQRVMGYRSGFP